jgi:TonB family protein
MLRRFWPSLLVLVTSTVSAAALNAPVVHPGYTTIDERAHQPTLSVPARRAQFSAVARGRARCAEIQPPQALTTPDPLLTPAERNRKVRVSFIIGVDGRTHSPLILQSAGATGDRHVLQTVRNWRYRPATCNGVPTESEGKVEFSGH